MLTILQGDAPEQLRTLPDESVHCCVTSPPYWGLRDYSCDGQLGLEKTPEEYVAKMVQVFREVRRVLRKDGTLWLNMGDSYCAPNGRSGGGEYGRGPNSQLAHMHDAQEKGIVRGWGQLKPKDLCGIPWRLAFALQADGWWLRSDIIWAKPNPMPESVTDRCTKAHEYLFLLTKSDNYFYDAEAIREVSIYGGDVKSYTGNQKNNSVDPVMQATRPKGRDIVVTQNRNKRSVWTVATAPYPEAHFATYPPDLIKPCILAGTSAKGCCAKCGAPWERVVEALGPTNPNRHVRSSDALDVPGDPNWRGGTGHGGLKQARMGSSWKHETRGWRKICRCIGGDVSCLATNTDSRASRAAPTFDPAGAANVHACTVLDPFAGSGTTGAVALELGRKAILIELNPKYVELIKRRCDVTPGLALA